MIRRLACRSGRHLLVTLFSALALSTLPAHAYSTAGRSWAPGTVTFHMSLGNAVAPLIDGNTSWNAAAAPALDQWNERMGSIQLARVMDSSAPVVSGDRVNSIAFSSTVFGQAFGTGTLAVTYFYYQGNRFLEADVLFNLAQTFDSYRGPLRFTSSGYALGDIRRVLVHELGHGLGLNHYEGDNIMASLTSNRENPSADDTAGIQSLYGAPAAPTPPPAPTPTPAPPPPPAQGSFVTSDFNSDAGPDLIWQNRITGQRSVWFLNGTTMTSDRFLPTVPVDWDIVTTADFNRDGHSDIVWQNRVNGQRAIWLMNGSNYVGERFLPTIPTQWQIAGAGDFNRDGHSDLIWQNTVTGQRAIWLMNDTTMVGERWLPTIPVSWEIVGTDDFNRDGHIDLVWQDNASGMRAIWLMNTTDWVGERWLPTIPTEWKIAGTGDFNADGHSDLIWQNTITGFRAVWLMRETAMAGESFLPIIPTDWEIRNR